MILTCPSCDTRYNVPGDKLSSSGSKVRCTQCGEVFTAYPESQPEEAAEAAPAEAPTETPAETSPEASAEAPAEAPPVPDPAAEDASEPTPEPAPEPAPEATPEAAPEAEPADPMADPFGDDGLGDDLLGGDDLGGDAFQDDDLGGDDLLGGGLDEDLGSDLSDGLTSGNMDDDLGGDAGGLGDGDADGLDAPAQDEDDDLGLGLGADLDATDGGLDDGFGGDLEGQGTADDEDDMDLSDLLGGLDGDSGGSGGTPAGDMDSDLDGDLGGDVLGGGFGQELDDAAAESNEFSPEGQGGEDLDAVLGGMADETPAAETQEEPAPAAMEDDDDDLSDLGLGDDTSALGGLSLGGQDSDDRTEPQLGEDDGAEEEGAAEDDEDDDSDVFGAGGSYNLDEQGQGSEDKSNNVMVVAIVGLLLLLIGGGVALYALKPALPDWVPEQIRELLGQEAEPEEAAQETPQDQASLIFLQNVRQYVVDNEKTGRLLVVEGKAVNNFDTPREMIRVQVSLLDAQGSVLDRKDITCGNTLSLFQLQIMSRTEIQASLASELGILSNNTNLAQGQGVPFMVVFFNPPSTISEYKVDAIGAKAVAQ